MERHRPQEHQGRRERRRSSRSPASPATSSSTSTATTSRSSRSTCSRATRNTDIATGNLGDTSKIVGTGPYVVPVRRRRHRRRRSSGRSAATGGRRRRSGQVRRRRRTSSTSRTARTPPRCRTCSPGTSTCSTTSRRRRRSRGKFKTYFDKAPYHLGANTTWLFPNTTKKPLNDRRVPSCARDLDQHEPDPRQGVPGPREQGEPDRPAADLEQVDRRGRSSSSTASRTTSARRSRSSPPPATRTRTATATSRTRTGRRSISSIVCPNGWSDWMTSIQVIADSAKAAGIKITPSLSRVRDDGRRPRPRELRPAARQRPAVLSNTPWTYYQYIYQLPIPDNQTTVNYERYSDPTAWNLTQAAGQDALDEHQGLPGQ